MRVDPLYNYKKISVQIFPYIVIKNVILNIVRQNLYLKKNKILFLPTTRCCFQNNVTDKNFRTENLNE